jgi:4-hydroxyproline epimerase
MDSALSGSQYHLMVQRLQVIDSHTGGEPTRVVVDGLPELGGGSIADRLAVIEREHDRYRTAVIGEPRSPTFAVAAYLLPSSVADFGVVFFNNARYLGMCGHGTIGLITTLYSLGQIDPGKTSIETPVGIVHAELHEDGRVSFENVPCYRLLRNVSVASEEGRGSGINSAVPVSGDVAYGGNWFFISSEHGMQPEDGLDVLLQRTLEIRSGLVAAGITDGNGGEIDHVELVWPTGPLSAKNFVLCPGGEYDRSPCGTGTCAKLACLYEDGKLKEGETYVVESIIGSTFEGSIRKEGDKLIPRITGRAYVNGETTLLIDPDDPFAWGIP